MSKIKKLDNKSFVIDEHPHEQQPIEWWFVQGYFEGPSTAKRYFMNSIFRHVLCLEKKREEAAYMLLSSVLDPKKERHETLSQIDKHLIKFLNYINKDRWKGNLDSTLVDTFVEESISHGPLLPLRMERSAVKLQISPFKISWKDFSLSQTERAFHLSFKEPDSHRVCQFDLSPVRPRIFRAKEDSSLFDAMAYASYPTLQLKGLVDGKRVKGQAWLDHQWGNYGGWFINQPKEAKLRGWDWFGINLSDGSEILSMIHRDMKSHRPVDSFGVARLKGKLICDLSKIVIKPIKYWRSSRTHIQYPVQWQLRIKEIEADLMIEALVDDQEISIFGLARAIWEGVAKVKGSVRGHAVSGHARVELFGYGFIFDFKDYSNHLIAQFDESLNSFFPKKITTREMHKYVGTPSWKYEPQVYTKILSTPVWDLIGRKGKRWRSLFSLLLLESLGVPFKPYISLISVIPELAHSGSLIVDDIEDNSKLRRGDKCIHLKYGLDVSLNAANTIYYLPYLILVNHPCLSSKQQLKLYEIMIKYAVQAHFGQGLDIYWSRNMTRQNLAKWSNNSTADKVLQMYEFKTSSVIEESAEFACVIANANSKVKKACVDFSRIFGVAFQIMDDIHNLNESKKWTKASGEDISSGKLTLILIRALQLLPKTKRKRLLTIMGSKSLRNEDSYLKAAISLIRESGSIEICRKEAKRMFEEEWLCFSRKIPNSEAKIMIGTLCRKLLSISFE